jgi:LmbE family N-acetylglucosaminyl deacetylase
MKDTILVVGAHPDDIELGCGGTIAKNIAIGNSVHVLVMTNGESGGHAKNMEECMKSLKKLGVPKSNILFGNFPDGYLVDNLKAVDFIEKHVRSLGATKVYTHAPTDRHQDHRNCSCAVSAAARKVPQILLFQGPSTTVTFEPHYFIQLSEEELNKKIESLSCYETQIKKGCVNLAWIRHLAGMYGSMCNAEYAEAFSINHIIEGKNK